MVVTSSVSIYINADFDYRVENANFTIYQDSFTYNYDRLRFRADVMQGKYFSTVIADGVNFHGDEFTSSNDFSFLKSIESDTPFKTQSDFHNYNGESSYLKLYRLYGGYEDEKNRAIAGLINIPMGVGRIWTPTNIFNPKNSYALESDEVFGVGLFFIQDI